MEAFLANLWSQLTGAGLKLIYALVVLFVGLKLVGWLCSWFKKSPRFEKLDPSLKTFLDSALSISLRIIVIVSAALVLGIPSASFVAILTSAGVAIGLALQGSLSNLAGGLMILFFKPFKVGDFVETSGGTGVVRSIGVFYTMLGAVDGRHITIPNGALTNNPITNYSEEPFRGMDCKFTVAYSSDSEQVKAVLLAAAEANPVVVADPAPMVWMSAHGDNAVEYTLRVSCNAADYFTLHTTINDQVKSALDQAGIEIPFPQVDVHMK